MSYRSGLAKHNERFLLSEIGVEYIAKGDWCPYFIRVEEKIGEDIPKMDYVMYDGGVRVEAMNETEILAWVGRPYFNRSRRHFTSHRHAPFKEITDIPDIVRKHNIIYIASPIFRAYKIHGVLVYKRIVQNCINLLLPEKLVPSNLPSTAEVTLNRQGNSFILHILHYILEKRSQELEIIEDTIPLYNTKVRIKTEREPSKVYLVQQKDKLDFAFEGNYTTYSIP